MVVANGSQLDEMGLVESCFVVLLRRLAHTLPRIADYQGGFYDDQAFCMVVVVVANVLRLDERGSVESWFVVLLRRLARHQGGFHDDQAFCMIVVVVIGLLLDEKGLVESCFEVLHHHLARTGLQIADDQEFYMVMESGFRLDEMGSQELCSETCYWPQAHTLPRSGLHRVLCGDQACGMEMEKGF